MGAGQQILTPCSSADPNNQIASVTGAAHEELEPHKGRLAYVLWSSTRARLLQPSRRELGLLASDPGTLGNRLPFFCTSFCEPANTGSSSSDSPVFSSLSLDSTSSANSVGVRWRAPGGSRAGAGEELRVTPARWRRCCREVSPNWITRCRSGVSSRGDPALSCVLSSLLGECAYRWWTLYS